MTFDEVLALPANTPCRFPDGSFGLLIRFVKPDEAGFQVPGEEDIRYVKVDQLTQEGNVLLSSDNGWDGRE